MSGAADEAGGELATAYGEYGVIADRVGSGKQTSVSGVRGTVSEEVEADPARGVGGRSVEG